jgi:hypothetical protein
MHRAMKDPMAKKSTKRRQRHDSGVRIRKGSGQESGGRGSEWDPEELREERWKTGVWRLGQGPCVGSCQGRITPSACIWNRK